MSKAVLDTSALLAYLNNEPGNERVDPALSAGAWLSPINYAEVLSWFAERGQNPRTVEANLISRGLLGQALELAPLTDEDIVMIAALRPRTKHLQLSLGDRACLALGLRLKLPVFTSDKLWKQLKLGIRINLIR